MNNLQCFFASGTGGFSCLPSLETMVNAPLPLTAFLDTVLENQRALLGSLPAPIVSNRALLTLSRPVDSIMHGEHEILVMSFCGVFWLFNSRTGITGFFESENAAAEFAQAQNT